MPEEFFLILTRNPAKPKVVHVMKLRFASKDMAEDYVLSHAAPETDNEFNIVSQWAVAAPDPAEYPIFGVAPEHQAEAMKLANQLLESSRTAMHALADARKIEISNEVDHL